MKPKEYLEELNKIIEQNPEALEMDVIYAKDDEGKLREPCDCGCPSGLRPRNKECMELIRRLEQ